jgi:5-methylthioadenosine/S-adenosylhomocysteine deaminase
VRAACVHAEAEVAVSADRAAASYRTAYHARWVLPVTGPGIEDGTVVVEGDRIAYVGSRARAPIARDEELGDAVLMPGLVNAHTHLDLTVMRGFLEGLSFFTWIRTLTAARAELHHDDLLASAQLGVVEGLLAGVTTYADTAPAPAGFDAMRSLGVRGIAYREIFGPDPRNWQASADDLRRAVRAMRIYETPMVRVGVSPHAPYSVSDALYAAVAAYAQEHDLPVATHIAESEDEHDLVAAAQGAFAAFLHGRKIDVAVRGRSPIAMLEKTGILAQRALLIHCVRVDAEDIAAIASHGCGVAHCPASNAKLGHGIAPLTELLAAGVHVGLGSDSMASNNRMAIVDEGRLAILAQRMRQHRDDVLDARAVLEMATIGGARALGMGGVVGSLEVGKRADLVAFRLPATSGQSYRICDALTWSLGTTPAARVVVNGVERVRDGVVHGVDVDALATKVGAIAHRLAAWNQQRQRQPG